MASLLTGGYDNKPLKKSMADPSSAIFLDYNLVINYEKYIN